MLSYTKLQTKPRIFRSLSGLSLKEFEALLSKFEQAWQAYVMSEYIQREGRKRQYGGGRKAELVAAGVLKLGVKVKNCFSSVYLSYSR
jgi:hypothetical protein